MARTRSKKNPILPAKRAKPRAQASSLPKSATGKHVKYLGRCDQGGRPDGVQIMVKDGYAIVGHMFADGFSVIDVRDPRRMKTVAFVPAPPNTRAPHLQVHENLLL